MRAVNLIPVEQRSGTAPGGGRSGGGAYAVLGLLAGLSVLALLYGSAHRQASSNRAKAAAVEAQVQQAQATAAKLAPYTSFMSLREQRAQAVSELVDSRFDWAHAFHELGRVLPKHVSIATLSGTIGPAGVAAASASASAAGAAGGSTAGATPPGSVPTFTLSGCATSQSMVATTLDRLRLIDGVSSVTLQSSNKSGAGAASSGSCPSGDPAFSVSVAFQPLPTAAALKSATPASAVKSASTAPASPTSGSPASKPAGSIGGT